MRAVLFGLVGVRLTAAGLVLAPSLPAGWGPVRLLGVPFRGSTYDITVDHASRRDLHVDGVSRPWGTAIAPTGSPRQHVVVAHV